MLIVFSPNVLFFGFFDQERLIAFISAEVSAQHAVLQKVHVIKVYRNNGLAKQLIRHLEQHLHQQGISRIYCFTQYDANYLERLGYSQTIIQKLPSDVLDNHDNLTNRIIMTKALAQLKKRQTQQELHQQQLNQAKLAT